MKDEIKKRTNLSAPAVDAVLYLVDKYDLNLKVTNFVYGALIMEDLNDQKVLFVESDLRSNEIKINSQNQIDFDIAVFIRQHSPIILGWAHRDDLYVEDDQLYVMLGSLSSMPKNWRFVRTCPHLDVFGGLFNDGFWECLGCGKLIQSNVG